MDSSGSAQRPLRPASACRLRLGRRRRRRKRRKITGLTLERWQRRRRRRKGRPSQIDTPKGFARLCCVGFTCFRRRPAVNSISAGDNDDDDGSNNNLVRKRAAAFLAVLCLIQASDLSIVQVQALARADAIPVTASNNIIGPIVQLKGSNQVKFEGVRLSERVQAFLGIRYASAPIKRLRFMPPTPYSYASFGLHPAHTFGPICMQLFPAGANSKWPQTGTSGSNRAFSSGAASRQLRKRRERASTDCKVDSIAVSDGRKHQQQQQRLNDNDSDNNVAQVSRDNMSLECMSSNGLLRSSSLNLSKVAETEMDPNLNGSVAAFLKPLRLTRSESKSEAEADTKSFGRRTKRKLKPKRKSKGNKSEWSSMQIRNGSKGSSDLVAASSKLMSRASFIQSAQLLNRLAQEREQSEDCLNLNIYVPSNRFEPNKLLPVLVIVHGESFDFGAGSTIRAERIVESATQQQLIAVTFNYRLNIFGFPPKLSAGARTNFGLMDQVAALHWIRDNIGSFGGAPDDITVMGSRKSAIHVSLLMLSPLARGLFKKAVLEDGSALTPLVANQISSPLQTTRSQAQQSHSSTSKEAASVLHQSGKDPAAANYLRLLAKLNDCPIYLPAQSDTGPNSAAQQNQSTAAARSAPVASPVDESRQNGLMFECLRSRPADQLLVRLPSHALQLDPATQSIRLDPSERYRSIWTDASNGSLTVHQSVDAALINRVHKLALERALAAAATGSNQTSDTADDESDDADVALVEATANEDDEQEEDYLRLFSPASSASLASSVRPLFLPQVDGVIVPGDEELAGAMLRRSSAFGARSLLIGWSRPILSSSVVQATAKVASSSLLNSVIKKAKPKNQRTRQRSRLGRLSLDHLIGSMQVDERLERKGLTDEQAVELVSAFVRSFYRYHNQEIVNTIINQYLSGGGPRARLYLQRRKSAQQLFVLDSLLDAFQDALVNVPILKTALIHALAQLDPLESAFVSQQLRQQQSEEQSPTGSYRALDERSIAKQFASFVRQLVNDPNWPLELLRNPADSTASQPLEAGLEPKGTYLYQMDPSEALSLLRELASNEQNRWPHLRARFARASAGLESTDRLALSLSIGCGLDDFGDDLGEFEFETLLVQYLCDKSNAILACFVATGNAYNREKCGPADEDPAEIQSGGESLGDKLARFERHCVQQLDGSSGNGSSSGSGDLHSVSPAASTGDHRDQSTGARTQLLILSDGCERQLNKLALDYFVDKLKERSQQRAAATTSSSNWISFNVFEQHIATLPVVSFDSWPMSKLNSNSAEASRSSSLIDSDGDDVSVDGSDSGNSTANKTGNAKGKAAANESAGDEDPISESNDDDDDDSKTSSNNNNPNDDDDDDDETNDEFGNNINIEPTAALSFVARASFWANFVAALNCSRTQPISPTSLIQVADNSTLLLSLNLQSNCATGARTTAQTVLDSYAIDVRHRLLGAGSSSQQNKRQNQNHHSLRMASLNQTAGAPSNSAATRAEVANNSDASGAKFLWSFGSDFIQAQGGGGDSNRTSASPLINSINAFLRSKQILFVVLFAALLMSVTLVTTIYAIVRRRNSKAANKSKRRSSAAAAAASARTLSDGSPEVAMFVAEGGAVEAVGCSVQVLPALEQASTASIRRQSAIDTGDSAAAMNGLATQSSSSTDASGNSIRSILQQQQQQCSGDHQQQQAQLQPAVYSTWTSGQMHSGVQCATANGARDVSNEFYCSHSSSMTTTATPTTAASLIQPTPLGFGADAELNPSAGSAQRYETPIMMPMLRNAVASGALMSSGSSSRLDNLMCNTNSIEERHTCEQPIKHRPSCMLAPKGPSNELDAIGSSGAENSTTLCATNGLGSGSATVKKRVKISDPMATMRSNHHTEQMHPAYYTYQPVALAAVANDVQQEEQSSFAPAANGSWCPIHRLADTGKVSAATISSSRSNSSLSQPFWAPQQHYSHATHFSQVQNGTQAQLFAPVEQSHWSLLDLSADPIATTQFEGSNASSTLHRFDRVSAKQTKKQRRAKLFVGANNGN